MQSLICHIGIFFPIWGKGKESKYMHKTFVFSITTIANFDVAMYLNLFIRPGYDGVIVMNIGSYK